MGSIDSKVDKFENLKIERILKSLFEFEKMLIPIYDQIAEKLYIANNKSFMKRFYGI
jgi:hypothetical protein